MLTQCIHLLSYRRLQWALTQSYNRIRDVYRHRCNGSYYYQPKHISTNKTVQSGFIGLPCTFTTSLDSNRHGVANRLKITSCPRIEGKLGLKHLQEEQERYDTIVFLIPLPQPFCVLQKRLEALLVFILQHYSIR